MFSGKVYHPEPPHAQSLFLFPIVFGINLSLSLSPSAPRAFGIKGSWCICIRLLKHALPCNASYATPRCFADLDCSVVLVLVLWADMNIMKDHWLFSSAWSLVALCEHNRSASALPIIPKTIPKTIGNRKKRLCLRLRSGDKHHLRKFAVWKGQISPVNGTNAFLVCAFRSPDFLRWCLSPRAQPHAQSLFFWY